MAKAPHGFAGRVVEAIEGIDELGVVEDHELVEVVLLQRLANGLEGLDVLVKLGCGGHGPLPDQVGLRRTGSCNHYPTEGRMTRSGRDVERSDPSGTGNTASPRPIQGRNERKNKEHHGRVVGPLRRRSQEALAYSDTGLSPGTARHYRVSAITAAGTSKPSETASATTPVHAHCTSGTGGDFWCAVLVVKDLGFAARGCHDEANKECSDTSVLTDGAFAYNDSSHEFRSISVNSFRLRVELEDAFPSDSDGWALHVGSAAFDVADADKVSMKIRGWSNPGLSWSVGDTVPLRLGATPSP